MTSNTCPMPLDRQYRMLVRGLGWLGSFGLLSSGMALAQGSAGDVMLPAPTVPSVDMKPSAIAPTVNQPNVALPETIPIVATPALPAPAKVIVQPQRAQLKPLSTHPDREDGYDAPTSIVLTERSTGCRAVLRSGQVLDGSPCALDNRYAPKAQVAAGGLPTVSVSPFNVSATGLGPSTVSTSWQAPTWQAYYKRTARPSGRLGNGNISLIFPLSIPAPISSLFGWRVHPVTGTQRFHSGTDLAAPLGTPVLAAYAGKVAIADFLGGYGLAVTLDHNKGTQQTIYAHLSEIFVKPGESVKQGMVIGRVGSTGLSTGPHLHFEFRQLTPDGWVAMDAGAQLEYALAQLVRTMQVAQAKAATTRS